MIDLPPGQSKWFMCMTSDTLWTLTPNTHLSKSKVLIAPSNIPLTIPLSFLKEAKS